MDDAREDLRQQLCMLLINHDIPNASMEVDMVLNGFEIQKRCTELAVLQVDRNNFLIQRFIIAKTVSGSTDRTLEAYRTQLKRIFDKIGKTIDDVTVDDLRYYIAVRKLKDKVSDITQDNERRILSTFYSFLLSEELITKNPMLRIGVIKTTKIPKEAFTELEVEKIRNATRNAREKAIVELLLSTGCRVSELVQILKTDVQTDKILVHGKGKKDRIVYLNAKAIIALENYLAERTDANPYIFPGSGVHIKELTTNADWYKDASLVSQDEPLGVSAIENLTKDLKERADLKSDCYPHKFRRTCATFALKRGMPIEQVSKMLGHKRIETTQIYLDLGEEELEYNHKKYVV